MDVLLRWFLMFELEGYFLCLGYCDIEVPKNEFPHNFEFPDNLELETTSFPLKDLRFLGMISAHDPVRPSTVEAIRNLRNAGIKVSGEFFLN